MTHRKAVVMLMARDIMVQSVVYVKPSTPVLTAMEMLVSHNIRGIPVVKNDMTLVGIITEKDILRINADFENSINKTVFDFMTQPAISFEENESILDVCQCLTHADFRRVPVTSSGRLVGIISRRDLIKKMLNAARASIESVEY